MHNDASYYYSPLLVITRASRIETFCHRVPTVLLSNSLFYRNTIRFTFFKEDSICKNWVIPFYTKKELSTSIYAVQHLYDRTNWLLHIASQNGSALIRMVT